MNDQEFESFRHWALTSVEELGRHFIRPDEDWLPVLLLRTPRGGIIAGIDLAFYQSDACTQALVKRLGRVIFSTHATAFALVQETWRTSTVATENNKPAARERAIRAGRLPPRASFRREETVVIHMTDDVHDELWAAVIQRRPRRPPSLGPWENFDLKAHPGQTTGRFLEPLRAALQRARARNN